MSNRKNNRRKKRSSAALSPLEKANKQPKISTALLNQKKKEDSDCTLSSTAESTDMETFTNSQKQAEDEFKRTVGARPCPILDARRKKGLITIIPQNNPNDSTTTTIDPTEYNMDILDDPDNSDQASKDDDDLERLATLTKPPSPSQYIRTVERDPQKPPADEYNIEKIWENIHNFTLAHEQMNSLTMAQAQQLKQHEIEIQKLKQENDRLAKKVEKYKREEELKECEKTVRLIKLNTIPLKTLYGNELCQEAARILHNATNLGENWLLNNISDVRINRQPTTEKKTKTPLSVIMVSKQARDYVVKAYPATKNTTEAKYAEIGLPVQCFPDRLYDIIQALRDYGTDEKNNNSEMQTRVIILRGRRDRVEGSGSEAVPTFALQGRIGGNGNEWVILAQETEPEINKSRANKHNEVTDQQSQNANHEQIEGFGKGHIQVERTKAPPRGNMNPGLRRQDRGREMNDHANRNNRDTRKQRTGDDFRQRERGYQHNPNYQPITRNSYSNSGNGQQNYQGHNTINMTPFQGQDFRYLGNMGPSQPPVTIDSRWQNQGNGYRAETGHNGHQGYQQQQHQQHQGQQIGPTQNHISRDDFYE